MKYTNTKFHPNTPRNANISNNGNTGVYYACITESGDIDHTTLSVRGSWAIRNILRLNPSLTWKWLYSKGWRVKKFKVTFKEIK